MIELKKVNKIFDDGFQALTDVDVEFADGKINMIIGPSGCGKTTTMKLLNRLVDYTDGQVLFNGKEINEINPIELRRQMGFVIQNIGLFPHMTIYNNVATVPKLLKWDKEKIRKRVIELLHMVNLDPETYMNRYPSELSGGQQQRIGVIRALAAEPSIILMDEPFSALDPISRDQLQDELVHLQTNIQKTIIFVTHDMDEAIKIADHIILMKDGQVVQQGPPTELLTNPVNDFVREFIGEKRLLTNQTFNQLHLRDYLITEAGSVSSDMSIKDAIKQLATTETSEVPVVDEEETYVGVLRLYTALEQQDKQVRDVVQSPVLVVTEDEAVALVLDKLQDVKQVVPVVSREKKLLGVLDTNKLFSTLQHITESKRGEK